MPKIEVWTNDIATARLRDRLTQSKQSRRPFERQWSENYRTVYSTRMSQSNSPLNNLSVSFISPAELGITDIDAGNTDIAINYVMKDIRLIHSQLSANPPSVIPRPQSNDPSDKHKADGADRLVRYGMRKYDMQEKKDRLTLASLIYGSGFVKGYWNPELGEIVDYDEETGEVTMEGDYEICIPSPFNVFPDPDASTWEDVRYVFECIVIPWEQAMYMFPDKEKEMQSYRTQGKEDPDNYGQPTKKILYDSVRLYQYWEKGLPYNGMVGRFVWCLEDGTPLCDVKPNPHAFARPKTKMDPEDFNPIKVARLPYNILTDIDVPDSYWGMSVVSYSAALQDMLNRFDNVVIETLQAHGIPRMILPEGTEVADESITNSPWDIVKITGAQPPFFMNPMALPTGLDTIRDRIKMGINDMNGTNEAMYGQQSREQSGFSMQYASQQGQMIRRRVFNKFVNVVEDIYKDYLLILRDRWSETRTIHVLGKENAFEAVDIKGADIDGGFDLVVEYGASLSLDPMTRREEILTMMPLFEKAGVSTRSILQMLKLNELEGVYDNLELATSRQSEIFREMKESGAYIAPEKLQDHRNMLDYAYTFVMSAEYKYWPDGIKTLVEKHIEAREQLAATQASASPGGTPAPGSAAPQAAAAMPVGAGQSGQPAQSTELGMGPGNPGPSA